MNEELINEIKKCINDLDQIQIIKPNLSDLVQACKKFLFDLGYGVTDPPKYRFKATKIGVMSFFPLISNFRFIFIFLLPDISF